jgi:hypothetical protein
VPNADARLAREAERVYLRYAIEIVEALGFCPYAQRARLEGQVRTRVMLDESLDEERACVAIDEIAADVRIDIGLLLYPRLEIDRLGFERFVARVHARNAKSHAPEPVAMALADFHPDPTERGGEASARAMRGGEGALTRLVRRTPDPTIQLVRRSALDRVRRDEGHGTGFVDLQHLDLASLTAPTTPPLHARIATINRATIARLGVDEVSDRLDDILRDRNESYAAALRTSSRPPRLIA